MATTIGTSLKAGTPDLTSSGYHVQSWSVGGADIDSSDHFDGTTGERITRLVFNIDKKINAELLASGTHTESSIQAHWPEGAMATLAPYTSYFVDSCSIAETKDAWRVSLSLTDIGIP